MKTPYWLHMLTLSAVLVGCSEQTSSPEQGSAGKPSAPGEQLTNKTAAALDAAKSQVAQSKDAFVQAADQSLKALSTEVQQLQVKVASLAGTAKTEAEQALEGLGLKQDKAKAEFEKVKAAAEDGWQQVKEGYDVAAQDLKKAIEDLRAKLGG